MYHKIFLWIALLLLGGNLYAQNKSGYYIKWDIDHTDRQVKPSIPISAEEAKYINCYYVKFDSQNRCQSVKFYYQGKPGIYSNFGAHEIVRTYFKNHFTETYKDTQGKSIANNQGVYKVVFSLNQRRFWRKKQFFNHSNKPIEVRGIAEVHMVRDQQNRAISEIQLNLKGDTIPDVNGFKQPYFAFTKEGLALYRQNRNQQGQLVNGAKGYAVVNFLFDENGNFVDEEFRDAQGKLFARPNAVYARINFREFNKYGKPARVYFLDQLGRPLKKWAHGIIEYYADMNRKSITFYDNQGNKSTNNAGVSTIVYQYNSQGKFMGRIKYDIQGKKMAQPK
ncbi:hypothetical protein BKI52_17310 [marine bacterium AO1-C]|nr:hypothetical protein BKI52_17310 [marine bacterium AO1-C]